MFSTLFYILRITNVLHQELMAVINGQTHDFMIQKQDENIKLNTLFILSKL